MKEEKQQIAIAEICGWINCISPHADEYHFLTDLELGLAMGAPVGRNCQLYSDGLHYAIPNYPNDLNAMHEAEKVLQQHMAKWWNYTSQLAAANSTLGAGGEAHATAKQRAEAFLRVFGKWEETE
jgi:hypothetical protein